MRILVGATWVDVEKAPKTAADAGKLAETHGVDGDQFGFKTDKGEIVTSGKVPASETLEVVEIPTEVAAPDGSDAVADDG